MKAAKFFSICEIVCFVGLALSYIGYASQSLEVLSRYFVLGVFLFSLLILLLSVCNLIAAVRVKKRLNDPAIRSTIWKMVVSMKLIAIPMFLVNFLYGIIYGVFSVIFVFTAPIVLMEILVAWFAMMASSGYCIAFILHARRQGKISTGTAVLQVISQFIYVVDVISLFFIRKTVKECETAQ
ncbi:MAG: hypothetical protein PUF64_04765 [Butyricicoccus sp.]|nr:hypothetical protein [Butyricicoccus sp.]